MCLLAFALGVSLNGGGNGWMHGIGRIGAFVSAFVGAWFLDWGWTFNMVLTVLAIPAFIMSASLWIKGWVYQHK